MYIHVVVRGMYIHVYAVCTMYMLVNVRGMYMYNVYLSMYAVCTMYMHTCMQYVQII